MSSNRLASGFQIRACKRCSFFELDGNARQPDMGKCHKRSPVPLVLIITDALSQAGQTVAAAFPPIDSSDPGAWCGEFEPSLAMERAS